MEDKQANVNIVEFIIGIHEALGEIKQDIGSIKSDISNGKDASADIDKQVSELKRQVYMAHGAIALVTFLGVIASFWNKIHG